MLVAKVVTYFQPNPPGKKTILVLKDQNFLDEKIELGMHLRIYNLLTAITSRVATLISASSKDHVTIEYHVMFSFLYV